MKKITLLVCLVFLSFNLFGQTYPYTIVNRNGRGIFSGLDEQFRSPIFKMNLYQENEVTVDIEYRYGHVYVVIIFASNYFTDCESFEMTFIADREFKAYREVYNSIHLKAEKESFNKNNMNSGMNSSREFKDGFYVSRFEISIPGNKFDVVKYVEEVSLNINISGKLFIFQAGPEDIRDIQDAGLIMDTAGLR